MIPIKMVTLSPTTSYKQRSTGRLCCILSTILLISCCQLAWTKSYYYTRLRNNPYHLRVSEESKNPYTNEVKHESKINGTKYEYYQSTLTMSHDELIFETIDKIFRHRLSPFYIHHYDNEEDKKRSSDPNIVSQEACARDLMYLVDKLPKSSGTSKLAVEDGAAGSIDSTNSDQQEKLSPELTAFFDSYARQESGVMMGNIFWVGAYDQCINRQIFDIVDSHHPDLQRPASNQQNSDQQVVTFDGRYCVAAIKSPAWDSMIKAKIETAKDYFQTERQINDYPRLFRLQVGICLPASCDSTSLERHSDELRLLTTSMLDKRYDNYELVDLYCLPDESSPLRSWSGSAFYFAIFIIAWASILFLATVADLCEFFDTPPTSSSGSDEKRQQQVESCKPRMLQRLVIWFSLRANYEKLMRVADEDEQPKTTHSKKKETAANAKTTDNTALLSNGNAAVPNATEESTESQQTQNQASSNSDHEISNQSIPEMKVSLRFLNAFKVIIMFWIVNGHIMLLMIQTAKNILNSDALLNGLMHLLIGATFGVDLFFTMTGFLTSYLMFNSGHAYKMKPTTWLYLSFHRYWRLAPMYLISFWFSRSVAQLLGSGPLWDYGTANITFRGLCNHESWWYPLTLTSNLHGLFEECMITSWYISCDMQFWLVSPIFIYLLAKFPTQGWIVSLSTIIMSSKLRYDAIIGDNLARHDELVQPRADIFMRVSHDVPALYTHPHFRIAAYIVGLLGGHYVYMIKSGKWKSRITSDFYPSNKQQQQQQQVTEGVASTIIKSSARSMNGQYGYEQAITKKSNTRRYLAYFGVLTFFVMSFISFLLSHYFPMALLKHARVFAAVAYAIDHLAMSYGACLIIITMCFGQWPKLTKFLTHPNWTRLSKINYALLLLQCEFIYFQIFRYDQVPVAGTRELINISSSLLVTLYPLAFVMTLAFEFPLANIEKLLI